MIFGSLQSYAAAVKLVAASVLVAPIGIILILVAIWLSRSGATLWTRGILWTGIGIVFVACTLVAGFLIVQRQVEIEPKEVAYRASVVAIPGSPLSSFAQGGEVTRVLEQTKGFFGDLAEPRRVEVTSVRPVRDSGRFTLAMWTPATGSLGDITLKIELAGDTVEIRHLQEVELRQYEPKELGIKIIFPQRSADEEILADYRRLLDKTRALALGLTEDEASFHQFFAKSAVAAKRRWEHKIGLGQSDVNGFTVKARVSAALEHSSQRAFSLVADLSFVAKE